MTKKRSGKTEKERELEMIKITIPIAKKKLEVARKRNKPKDVKHYSKVIEVLEELLE